MQLISSNLLSIPVAPTQDESSVEPSIQFGLKYCPSMDLIATFPRTLPTDSVEASVPEDGNDDGVLLVEVFRLNGQKAFTVAVDGNGKSIGITDVSWREDGTILAIITSDSTVRLVNCFSGKVVHTFPSQSRHLNRTPRHRSSLAHIESLSTAKRSSAARSEGPRKRHCSPTTICYSRHFSAPKKTKARLAQLDEKSKTPLDDILGLHADVDELLKLEANLPKELANIDVEQYLPKLSTLPASGLGEDDVFSTRISIDTVLHASTQNTRSNTTDVMTVAQSDANVHIRIFDSFEVGDVDLNHALNLPAGCVLTNIRKIVTHPFSEKLYMLVDANHTSSSSPTKTRQAKSGKANRTSLHLLSLDLRFLQQSSITLPILATKATQLHNLIRYLRQIELLLARETKTAFDLPTRFIRTLEEDLKEQDGDGSTFETSAYHALLTGEVDGKFKEWLVDILGDRGVKRWEKAVTDCLEIVRRLMCENWNPAVERAGVVMSGLTGLAMSGMFQVDKTLLESLRDSIDVMAVTGEDLLREVSAEITGFAMFIAWLKREVEAAGLEDTSEKLEEMRDGSDHSGTREVLKYISERLQHTSVKKYIHDEKVQDTASNYTNNDLKFYQTFRENRIRDKEHFSPPSMKFLTTRLGTQCEELFGQLTQQLQENILAEHVCAMDYLSEARVMDCRIVSQPEYAVLYIYADDSRHKGRLRRLVKVLESDSSQTESTDITLEDASDILDIQCVDDEEVMVLVRARNTTKVLSVRSADMEVKTRYVFGGAQDSYAKLGLTPWRLDINGRKARRTMTVLDEQGRGYGVFDLDSVESDTNKDGDEAMSG